MNYKYMSAIIAGVLAVVPAAVASDNQVPKKIIKEGECFTVNTEDVITGVPCKITTKPTLSSTRIILKMQNKIVSIDSYGSSNSYMGRLHSINALPATHYLRDAESMRVTTQSILDLKDGEKIYCYESILTDICHN